MEKFTENRPRRTSIHYEPNKFYFCPNCRQIPKIKMNDNTEIEIECTCYQEDGCISEKKIKDISELSKYKHYTVSLETYLKEIDKKKELPCCDMKNKHPMIKADKYCTECNKWFCSKCLEEHMSFCSNHITMKTDGLIMHSLCDKKDCQSKGRIKFYCTKCRMHLCSECKLKHQIDHEVIEIENLISQDIYNKLTLEYKNKYKSLEELKASYFQLFKDLDNVLEYYKSLLLTYKLTKKVMNYNVRNNLIINQLQNIYSFKGKEYKTEPKEENKENGKVEESENKKKKSKHIINEEDITSKIKENIYRTSNKITAEYNLLKKGEDEDQKYLIIGTEYNGLNQNNCTIKIDGNPISFSKYFSSDINLGKHTVEIFLNDGIFLEEISYMFSDCNSLIYVDLSQFNSSKLRKMEGLFNGCLSLLSINLKNFSTTKIINMEGIFSGCESLTSVDLSYFDTSNVTTLKGMFNECLVLKNLDLSNFKTPNLSQMKGMFFNCSSLTTLDLSSLDTSKVEDMSHLFNGCTKLKDLKIKNFKTANVKDMKYMFNNCSSLISLDLANFVTNNVTNMKNMFAQCSNLTHLKANFNRDNVTNSHQMFEGCNCLKIEEA